MYLHLADFKQYHERKFNLPDTGLIKISGRSGEGKSNFLKSIVFAVFGKINNVVPYGKPKGEIQCQVEMHFAGMQVLRQKGPNLLTVDGLKDDSAQSQIEAVLGMNELEFMVSSYVMQDLEKSLLSCDPKDQLKLIYSLAFQNTNPEETKFKIKTKIDEISNEVKQYESDLKTHENSAQAYIEKLAIYNSQLKNVELSKEELEFKISEFAGKHQQALEQKIAYRKTIDELEALLKDPNRKHYDSAVNFVDVQSKEIESLDEFINNSSLQTFDKADVLSATKEFFNSSNTEKNKLEEIEKLSKRFEECEERVQTSYETLEDLIENKLRPEIVEKRVTSKGLNFASGVIKKQIDTFMAYESLTRKDNRNETSIEQLAERLRALSKEIEELEHEKEEIELHNSKIQSAMRTKTTLEARINNAKVLIQTVNGMKPESEIKAEIYQLIPKMNEVNDELNEYSATLTELRSALSQLKENDKIIEKIKDLCWQLDQLKQAKKIEENLYKEKSTLLAELLKLQEISNRAALDAVEAKVQEINLRAEYWLDIMFEGSLQAKLETEKLLKNATKTDKLNLKIFENGNEIEKWMELSGGQRSRATLAFQLALSDLYNSPILLLDESLRGCDKETQHIALKAIRQIAQRKLVIMVEHHIPDSEFDKVIDIL